MPFVKFTDPKDNTSIVLHDKFILSVHQADAKTPNAIIMLENDDEWEVKGVRRRGAH